MTTPRLSVAVVGAGAIGRIHALVAAESENLELAAIVAPGGASASALADEVAALGAARPTTHASLVDALRTPVDIVAICTPSGTHLALAQLALAAGSHVIVEKPLDISLARARAFLAVADAASARGQVVSVMSQHRFDPASIAVREAVSTGGLGRLTSAIASVAWWRGQEYYDSSDWRGTWASDGGGALMNQGVHMVDLLLWLVGRPAHITAFTRRLAHQRIQVEDTAVAALSFASGALGVLHATTAAFPGLRTSLQVMGSLGSATIDNDQLRYLHTHGDQGQIDPMGLNGGGNQVAVAPGETSVVDPTRSSVGHARQYDDFVRAILTGTAPSMTVRDAVDALTTIHAAYVSAALGITVSFDDVYSGTYDHLLTDLQKGSS